MKPPKTKQDFARYLQDAFDTVKDAHTSDACNLTTIANLVEEVSIHACRFGAGDLIAPQRQTMTPREALIVIGRLLKWADENTVTYFDSRQAADYIGVTGASLYGLVERKRLVPLRGPRRTYRFTRKQLDNYLGTNTNLCV